MVGTANPQLVYFTNLFLVENALKACLSAVRAGTFPLQPFSETRVAVVLTTALGEPRVPQHLRADGAFVLPRVIQELIVVTARWRFTASINEYG